MLIYLFDIDGTLTKPRGKITPELIDVFYKWSDGRDVRLVTGSDRKKTIEQVGEEFINKYISYQCAGNEIWVGNKLIYRCKWMYPEDKLFKYLSKILNKSKFPLRCGTHFEYRSGMFNFSIIGRDCTQRQREQYRLWDAIHKERKAICETLNKKFNVVAQIGGEISIDIFEKGRTKGQVIENIGHSADRIIFFGDKTKPGENDYDIARQLPDANVITVNGPNQTKDILETWKDY